MQNLVDCEDGESSDKDCEKDLVDCAAHHALKHEVESFEVSDFAVAALLGYGSKALAAEGAEGDDIA